MFEPCRCHPLCDHLLPPSPLPAPRRTSTSAIRAWGCSSSSTQQPASSRQRQGGSARGTPSRSRRAPRRAAQPSFAGGARSGPAPGAECRAPGAGRRLPAACLLHAGLVAARLSLGVARYSRPTHAHSFAWARSGGNQTSRPNFAFLAAGARAGRLGPPSWCRGGRRRRRLRRRQRMRRLVAGTDRYSCRALLDCNALRASAHSRSRGQLAVRPLQALAGRKCSCHRAPQTGECAQLDKQGAGAHLPSG